jgi:site-specific recombinase XerD
LFEITEKTRDSIRDWVIKAKLKSEDYLLPSRLQPSIHILTRQYTRLVKNWVKMIGLDPATYGTHSMRRTKAAFIYKRTKNLRAVELLLGHTKIESTVRYLEARLMMFLKCPNRQRLEVFNTPAALVADVLGTAESFTKWGSGDFPS